MTADDAVRDYSRLVWMLVHRFAPALPRQSDYRRHLDDLYQVGVEALLRKGVPTLDDRKSKALTYFYLVVSRRFQDLVKVERARARLVPTRPISPALTRTLREDTLSALDRVVALDALTRGGVEGVRARAS